MQGMTFYEARDIAEGLIEYDDNHIRRLDDWFKKSSRELIEMGVCYPPAKRIYRRPNNRD